MPELVKITSDIFPWLYQAFLHDDDPLSSEQDWPNVFDCPWNNDGVHAGYAVLDNVPLGLAFQTFMWKLLA